MPLQCLHSVSRSTSSSWITISLRQTLVDLAYRQKLGDQSSHLTVIVSGTHPAPSPRPSPPLPSQEWRPPSLIRVSFCHASLVSPRSRTPLVLRNGKLHLTDALSSLSLFCLCLFTDLHALSLTGFCTGHVDLEGNPHLQSRTRPVSHGMMQNRPQDQQARINPTKNI
jgi:hypothetical protein